jgi:hypothetical protein
MSDLLRRLQGVGEVVGEGEFTLDVEAAGNKMARFQFRDEGHLLAQWVAALFHLGASAISLEIKSKEQLLVLRPEGIALDENLPAELYQHLLDEGSPYRRLAAAYLASLAHEPTQFEWIGQSKGQSFDSLTSKGLKWQKVRLSEIRIQGLNAALLERNHLHLRSAASSCRRPLKINGGLIPAARATHSWGRYVGRSQLDPQIGESQLHLVVDEILTDTKKLKLELPLQTTVYWAGPLDASLAAVIENESYQELLASLPTTYDSALLDYLRQPYSATQEARQFCLDLLELDHQTPWLAPHRNRLKDILLFVDHDGTYWSLQQLSSQPQPLLYSSSAPKLKVPNLKVLKLDKPALQCLSANLPQPPQEANLALLRERLRLHHQALWQARPQQPLQLPPSDWLAKLEMEQQWSLGILRDWSCSGGCLTLFHQGRWLAEAKLEHDEIPCQAVLEVPEADINELWDGLKEEALERWQRHFQEQLEGVVKKLAHESDSDSPLRLHLIGHLKRSRQPEKSYFAQSRLFRDAEGGWWSLKSLLEQVGHKRQLGWLQSDEKLDSLPAKFRPQALWLQGTPAELECLSKLKKVTFRQFSHFLADYQKATVRQSQPRLQQDWRIEWEGNCLAVDPALKRGEISLRVEGVWLGVQPVNHWLGYRAYLEVDDLEINLRLDNGPLGTSRYSLPSNQVRWKRLLAECQQKADQSLSRLLEREVMEAEWWPWLQELVLAGWGKKWPKLHQLAIWPTFPERLSLHQLLSQGPIAWSSLEISKAQWEQLQKEQPGRTFWPALPAQRQANLAQLGGEWENLDSWLAQREQEQRFLQKLRLDLDAPTSLIQQRLEGPSLQGLVAVVDAPAKLTWMRWQRPVSEEANGQLPYGFLGRLESDQLTVNSEFTEVGPENSRKALLAQAVTVFTELVERWLAESRPRPSSPEKIWFGWQPLSEKAEQLLRGQIWIFTNRGLASWNQLMEAPEFLRLDNGDYPKDLLVVLEGLNSARLLDSLCSQHPGSLSGKASEKRWKEWQKSRERQARINSVTSEMAHLRHGCQFLEPYEGQLAWTGREDSDVWWVGPDDSLPLDGWPTGWTGYVCPPLSNRKRIGNRLLAQISQSDRRALLAQASPALLLRLQAGHLKSIEIRLTAGFFLMALHGERATGGVSLTWQPLVEARWIPCSDGTLLSLEQASLLSQEDQLLYWRRNYPFSSQLDRPTLLLAEPTLLELLTRWCTQPPVPRPKPILFRDVKELAGNPFRGLLQTLASWVKKRPERSLKEGVKKAMKAPPKAKRATPKPPPPKVPMAEKGKVDRDFELLQQGRPLLTSLRRQASLLLAGSARKETLQVLDRLQWRENGSGPLWSLADPPQLNAQHPMLRNLSKDPEAEPPTALVLSLLLGLVSAINARSQAFSDDMELEFLEKLTNDLVETYKDVMPS